jgi:hypothetical protein
VFGMGARVPTQVISSLVPALRLPALAYSGSVPGLPPRSTEPVSHYRQARGASYDPATFRSVIRCCTTEVTPQWRKRSMEGWGWVLAY